MDRLPTDTLVEILQRLPHSCRRQARHVSRHWRDVVDNRITETHSSPKLLIWSRRRHVAYLADDLSPSSTGSCTELWRSAEARTLIGACNGLLCLYHGGKIMGGTVTLLNPATGEMLALPPLPCPGLLIGCHELNWQGWGDAYSFAYHPITGQFKVVHVPCSYEQGYDFHAVHVFTLGKATWREVSAGPDGAICKLAAGIVSIHGMTYWVRITGGAAAEIVSLDLTDDRVISTTTAVPFEHDPCRLAEVNGRLGYVVLPNVWVLEEGNRWRHRYSILKSIPRPHFVHGEYVLTCGPRSSSVFVRRQKGMPQGDDVVLVGPAGEWTLVAAMKIEDSGHDCCYHTFPYVETMEPLSIYAINQ